MTVLYGGKAVYGAAVGILMLDARFPGIPGDMSGVDAGALQTGTR